MYRWLLTSTVIFFFVFGGGCNCLAAQPESVSETWCPSPTGAALRSLVFPGWGQIYVRKPIKAVIYSGIEQAFIYGIYRHHKLFKHHSALGDDNTAEFYRNNRNRQAWYLAAAIIVSVMDAYVDAHLYQFDVSEKLGFTESRGGFLGSGVIVTFSWRVH